MPKGCPKGFPKERECDWCGESYIAGGIRSKHCSSACTNAYRHNKLRYDVEYVLKKRLAAANNRAVKKNTEADIDIDFLLDLWEEQEGSCALTGDEFNLGPSEDYIVHPQSPSLDRMDSSLGYTKDNVRLICYQVNMALGEYGEDALIEMARKLLGVAR